MLSVLRTTIFLVLVATIALAIARAADVSTKVIVVDASRTESRVRPVAADTSSCAYLIPTACL